MLAAFAAAPVAAVGACSSGTAGTGDTPGKSVTNDVTPTARDRLKDGGQLVWPVADIPANFNFLHLDGTLRDNSDIIFALMPSMYLNDAAGNSIWNRNYLAREPRFDTAPRQVVTYRLHEKATWNDGTPITFADFESQWKALNGRNPAFKVANSNGYQNIASVTRGDTDSDVVVTFAQPYTDWQSIFAPLYPKSTTSDPETFNNGWTKRMPGPTAGPFRFAALDQTARTVTIERDPAWWGNPAKLDRIIYRGVDASAAADAVANGEADFYEIAANASLYSRAMQMNGRVNLKRAGAPFYRHITINGARPHLADVRVRQALAMAIDRAAIARALLGPLGFQPQVLNNRIYMLNHAKYRDNAGNIGAYRPDAANALLDEAGWRLSGTTRSKNGAALTIDLVISAGVAESKVESELVRSMLARVGVAVTVRAVPAGDMFSRYVIPGNFDMAAFTWGGRPYPISINQSIFAEPKKDANGQLAVQQNYARSGSAEIDDLFRAATAELNPERAAEMANRIDGKLWQVLPNLPLYQRPDVWVVRTGLVNFGAFAYASKVYEDIGWLA
ncbi:ABC transporter family substrate-binding protein [Krasilnikovia cinnamomea]|uniref:ABC transporter family substrate-binding protein n=1 Tax=Krasilnikovia cinnamomea TaxID=349313 RepID=UPI0013EF2C5C|nr:ABC transporter family substrate-binding protein [Krasilnikovia cinnamomea]